MVRHSLLWIVGIVASGAVAGGCRGSEAVSSSAPDGAEAPVPVASSADAAPVAAKPESEPAPQPEPEPEPEPEPPPTLPDGTPILPCAEPPPGMACIPGGAFIRGTDEDEPANAKPQATIHLQTFYMDLNEVTFREYKRCQKERRCDRAGPKYLDFDHPKMPIQGVSWYHSRKYCQVHGKDLPTEAQWEKAARGPDGAVYPWGDEPVTCERAIIKDERGRSCGVKKGKSKPETGRPWDVASRDPGVYGLYDMVGNSWEWVIDWYSPSYEECGEDCTGIDPRGPCNGEEPCAKHYMRIVRGGSWYWDETRATGIFRRPHFPKNEPFHHFGFRCAATAEQAEALRTKAEEEAAAADGDAEQKPKAEAEAAG
ncbi:MAG: SUMF1/EgtB/PvdO family nonheme iron enzyme [Myxococcota bacterium]